LSLLLPKPTRRGFLLTAYAAAATAVLGGAGVYYGTQVEPHTINVTTCTSFLPNLPEALSGITIAQIADVHVGSSISLEDLAEICGWINRRRPDYVVWNGDLMNHSGGNLMASLNGETVPIEDIAACMRGNMDPRMMQHSRSFFAPGNHENFDTAAGRMDQVIRGSGIVTLRNEFSEITHNGQKLVIAGIEDDSTGKIDLNRALPESLESKPVFLLAHDPGSFHDVLRYNIIPLATFSGHMHGGQFASELMVQYGDALHVPQMVDAMALIGSRAPSKWYAGAIFEQNLHPDHAANPKNNFMFGSRGIGTTFARTRILSPPEIVIHQFYRGPSRAPVIGSEPVLHLAA
jgi:predicted MPP superfamily phosphohydrolase